MQLSLDSTLEWHLNGTLKVDGQWALPVNHSIFTQCEASHLPQLILVAGKSRILKAFVAVLLISAMCLTGISHSYLCPQRHNAVSTGL